MKPREPNLQSDYFRRERRHKRTVIREVVQLGLIAGKLIFANTIFLLFMADSYDKSIHSEMWNIAS